MYKTSLIDKVLKSGETIKINIDELTNGSHQKIEVICDVCDIECSLYTKLGFVENKKLKPDYSYIIGDCRIHKFNFRNSNNDNNIKIYDCGKIKFEYNI